MPTPQEVAQWYQMILNAGNQIGQAWGQSDFNQAFRQQMQPQLSPQLQQAEAMFGNQRNVGIGDRPSIDMPPQMQGVQNTPMVQPNILQALGRVVSQSPGMAQYAQPIYQQQLLAGQAAKAPFIEQSPGQLATNVITGETIEPPPFKPINQSSSLSNSWQAETDNNGDFVYEKIPGTNATRIKKFKWQRNPISGQVEKIYDTGTGGTLPQDRTPYLGLAKDRLVKSYQDSFNKDKDIQTYTAQGLSLSAVDGIIEEAQKGNQVSASALGVKVAKAMGEVGMLSESDVTRYVQARSLSRGAADKLSSWIKGVPTEATLQDIQQISNVIRDKYSVKVQPIINKYAEQMSAGMNISMDEAYRYLASENIAVRPKTVEKPKAKEEVKPTMPAKRVKPLEDMTDEELDAYEKSLTGGK
jgi:hypothetical protein